MLLLLSKDKDKQKMTKQITGNQIRRRLAKHFKCIGKYCTFENEEYGRALMDSEHFRYIAEQMERTGLKVDQVRQNRDILDPMNSWTSRSIGRFYLDTATEISPEELAKIGSLKNYTFNKQTPKDSCPYLTGYQGREWSAKPAIIIYQNQQPPVDGIRKVMKTLAELLVDPCVMGDGDSSVRIR